MDGRTIGLLISGLIFILVFWAGISSLRRTIRLLWRGYKARGIVVDIIEEYANNSESYIYTPLIEYENDHGEIITFEHEISGSQTSYRIDDEVTVIYDNNNSKIYSFGGLYGGCLLSLLGIILAGLFFIFVFISGH